MRRQCCEKNRSGQEILHDVSGDIRQPEITARVTESQCLMIESEQVQNGGVEVVDVNGILGDFASVVVSRTVDEARFHTSASQP